MVERKYQAALDRIAVAPGESFENQYTFVLNSRLAGLARKLARTHRSPSPPLSAVYRAKDTTLGREVAIKVLPADVASSPERLQRFEREAKTVAAYKDVPGSEPAS